MKRFTLIGHPLGHTLSPKIHKALFSLSGFGGEYDVTDLYELDEKAAKGLAELSGYNVTIPYKTRIIPFLTSLDKTAESIGAVNCVRNDKGTAVGYNTDCTGFMRSLGSSGISLSGRVLLLGLGGAGRMMAAMTLSEKGRLTVAVRNTEKAKETAAELTRNFGGEIELCTFENITGEYEVCLNSTPVGMFPGGEASPIDEKTVKCCNALFDAVYNPTPTRLMQMFTQEGKTAVGGMAMLVWQAAAAHEIWYGAKFDEKDISSLINEMNAFLK